MTFFNSIGGLDLTAIVDVSMKTKMYSPTGNKYSPESLFYKGDYYSTFKNYWI